VRQISHAGILFTVAALFAFRLAMGGYISIGGSVPDLVFIAVFFFGFIFGTGAGFEAGLAGGALTDIFSLDLPGSNAFILTVTGYAAGTISDKLSRDSGAGQFAIVAVFFILSSCLRYLVVSGLYMPSPFSLYEYLTSSAAPQALYTAVVAVPLFAQGIRWCGLRETEELL
jgi:rod shape-determining protein MreD